MHLMAVLAPQRRTSALAITAVKLFEPTLSPRDEYLNLAEDGRLIKVQTEAVDALALQRYETDPTVAKPVMLPLTMFCKTLGAAVRGLQLRGDPLEFPLELKAICEQRNTVGIDPSTETILTGDDLIKRGCDILLMPWRATNYVETLFWGSYYLSPAPIAVFFRKQVVEETEDVNFEAALAQRFRSLSNAISFKPSPVPTSDEESGISKDKEIQGSNSFFQSLPVVSIPGRGRANSTLNNLLESSVIAAPRGIKEVVGVLSGKRAGIQTMSLLVRLAQSRHVRVIALVTSEHETFPEVIVLLHLSLLRINKSCRRLLRRM